MRRLVFALLLVQSSSVGIDVSSVDLMILPSGEFFGEIEEKHWGDLYQMGDAKPHAFPF